MANKTIPSLTAASALTGAEQVEVVQGGNSRRSTTGAIAAAPGAPFDIATFIAGLPGANETVLRYVFARAVTFADEFGPSRASAGAAATASTVFTAKKNGTSVGTITFAASGTTGTFVTTGTTVSFAAGDVLELVAPASADGTLADISVTLAGTR